MKSSINRIEAAEKALGGRVAGRVADSDLPKISRAVELLMMKERTSEQGEELAGIDAYFLSIGEKSITEIFGHLMATV